MTRKIFLPLLLCAALCGALSPIARADQGQTNEAVLIKVLQSNASDREKSDACAELKRIATEKSVKALSLLLTNGDLSHSARYVLESMPYSKAGNALRDSLKHTSGNLKIGIINSLAVRNETGAVHDIGKSLSDSDTSVAVASAQALGRIGGSSALKLLQKSYPNSTGPLRAAEADGILACGWHRLSAGDLSAALKAFNSVYKIEKTPQIREAAFRGVILASGKNGYAVAAGAIANGDEPSRSAALHLATQLPGTDATRAFADLAVGAPQPLQLILLDCLARRGDPAAISAATLMANDGNASVRTAALTALATVGDDSSVRLLAERAAGAKGPERNAARDSLLQLNRGPVTKRMLEMLTPDSPKVEAEIITALGGRGDKAAIPALMNLAQHGNDDERAAALQAVGQLADASQIAALVQMVAGATSEDARSQTADALGAVYSRLPSASEQDVEALVKAVTTGTVEARLALLPVCSDLPQEPVRRALRAAITDSDTRIREAAIHALCDTHDPELLPDLLKLADNKDSESVRHLGVRGCVHLIAQEEDVKIPNDKKVQTFKQLLAGQLTTDEKRLVLSGISGTADDRALALAVGFLDDADVRPEAEKAILDISPLIRNAHPAKVKAALNKIVADTKSADNRQTAKDILEKIK